MGAEAVSAVFALVRLRSGTYPQWLNSGVVPRRSGDTNEKAGGREFAEMTHTDRCDSETVRKRHKARRRQEGFLVENTIACSGMRP
jgi:hypothetical protein